MADKPTCRKCGEQHWLFTKCESADGAELREQELKAERERLKVYPIHRDDPRWQVASRRGHGLKF